MLPTTFATQDLNPQEEKYVFLRARGIPPEAAMKQAGFRPPYGDVLAKLHENPQVNEALALQLEQQRIDMYKVNREIEFSKADATMMFLQAHQRSETATEEIKATESLCKLHNLYEPTRIEISGITSAEQLREMSNSELAEAAGTEILLNPEDFVDVS